MVDNPGVKNSFTTYAKNRTEMRTATRTLNGVSTSITTTKATSDNKRLARINVLKAVSNAAVLPLKDVKPKTPKTADDNSTVIKKSPSEHLNRLQRLSTATLIKSADSNLETEDNKAKDEPPKPKTLRQRTTQLQDDANKLSSSKDDIKKLADEFDQADTELDNTPKRKFKTRSKLQKQKTNALIDIQIGAKKALVKSAAIKTELTAVESQANESDNLSKTLDQISNSTKNSSNEILSVVIKKSIPEAKNLTQSEFDLLEQEIQDLSDKLSDLGHADVAVEFLLALRNEARSHMDMVAGKGNNATDADVIKHLKFLIGQVDKGTILNSVVGNDETFDDLRQSIAIDVLQQTKDYKNLDDAGKEAQVDALKAKHELELAKRTMLDFMTKHADKKTKQKLMTGTSVQSLDINAGFVKALRNIANSDKSLDREANLLIMTVRTAQDNFDTKFDLAKGYMDEQIMDDETLDIFYSGFVSQVMDSYNKGNVEFPSVPIDETKSTGNLDNLDDSTFQDYYNASKALAYTALVWDSFKFDELDYPDRSLAELMTDQSFDASLLFKNALNLEAIKKPEFDLAEELEAELDATAGKLDPDKAWTTRITHEEFEKVRQFLTEQLGTSGAQIEARRAKIELGALSNYGIDATDQKKIAKGGGDSGKDIEIQDLATQLEVLRGMATTKLVSIKQAESAVGLVNAVGTKAIGKDFGGSMATKVLNYTQSAYSTEVNSIEFLLKAKQFISGAADAMDLQTDKDFADIAKKKTKVKSQNLKKDLIAEDSKIKELEGKLTRLMIDRQSAENDKDNDKINKIDIKLTKAVAEYESAMKSWNDSFQKTFKNPTEVGVLVKAAILETRPSDESLKNYEPADQMAKIYEKLESWGIEADTVRPLIVENMMQDIGRKQVDDWTTSLESVMTIKTTDARKKAMELLLAQSIEMQDGGWLYVSDTSSIGVDLAFAFKSFGITLVDAEVGGSKNVTSEISIAKSSDGFSLKIYAGNGATLSAGASVGTSFSKKTKDIFSLKGKAKLSGTVSKLNGFALNFSNKDGKDAKQNFARFLKALGGGQDLSLKDAKLFDSISVFGQGANFSKAEITIDASAQYKTATWEHDAGPLDFEIGGGVGGGISISRLKKDKDTYDADSHTKSVLTAYNFTYSGKANLAASVTVNGDPSSKAPAVSASGGGNATSSLNANSNGDGSITFGGSVDGNLLSRGVIYGSSSVTRSTTDPEKYTAASFSYSTPTGKADPWVSVESLAGLARSEAEFKKWKEDDTFKDFRDEFDQLVKDKKSGADFVSISMTIKEDVLTKANMLLANDKEKEAKALIDDRANYEPTGISFCPTHEWSGSKTRKLIGVDIDSSPANPAAGFTTSATVSSSESAWGEMALPKKVEVPKPASASSSASTQ